MTVRNTLYRIQDKLGIGTKQELVIWTMRNSLVDDVVLGVDAQPTPGGAVTRDQPLRRVWGQGSRATFSSAPPNGASASGWRSRRQRTEEGRN